MIFSYCDCNGASLPFGGILKRGSLWKLFSSRLFQQLCGFLRLFDCSSLLRALPPVSLFSFYCHLSGEIAHEFTHMQL